MFQFGDANGGSEPYDHLDCACCSLRPSRCSSDVSMWIFAHAYPAMLLDEPTASLDVQNRGTVLGLIEEAKERGTAIIGIFHDETARDRVCDRQIDVTCFAQGRAA